MRISNVADVVAETLQEAGVARIYGVVGDSLNGITEALRARGRIDWIHTRHEEAARLRGRRRGAGHRAARRLRRAPAGRATCT